MHVCIHGFIGAKLLLSDIAGKSPSEYDLHQLGVYEERLKQAGYGNYFVQSSSEQLSTKLGDVTKNFFSEYEAKVKDANEKDFKRILYEYDEQLCSAGYGGHYDADEIKDLEEIIKSWIPSLSSPLPSETSNVQPETPNEVLQFISKVLKAQDSKCMVGLLTAINLHSELGMGIISVDELRKLGEYETQLKLAGFGSDTLEVVNITSEFPQENNEVTIKSDIGVTIDSFLSELAKKLISIDDHDAKNVMIEKHEQVLQLAGFGKHYDALKVEELTKELEELRMESHVKEFKLLPYSRPEI